MYAYIEDLLGASTLPEEHRQHNRMFLSLLKGFGLVLNKTKCSFGVPTIQFLSHVIPSEGIQPLPSKVQAVRVCLEPYSLCKLREVLGLLNFHRRFMHCCA